MANSIPAIICWRWLFLVLLFHFLIPALCQQNPPLNDPRDQNAVNIFYLTSRSDCRDELKNIFNNEARVVGYNLNNIGTGPTSCTIRITSTSVYPGIQLQIRIVAMNILDCRTQLSIYDGEEAQKLGSYDCRSRQNINRQHVVTSGDTVTFIMTRSNPDNFDFDIDIRVKPIRGGLNPDFDNTNYFSFQKFDQDAIVGMIGGFYGLVIIICVGLLCYFNIKYRGLDKKWETHQLETMRTDEKFQQRNLMNQRDNRNNGRNKMASQNSTYSDDDEDNPDNFKEKVITPRVRPGARWKPRNQRPPSFEEATRDDSSSGEYSDEGTEESSSEDDSTRKRLTTSSEGEEESETESESESERSSASSARGAKAKRAKGKNKKNKEKSKPRRRRQSSTDDAASSRRSEPRARQPPQAQHPQQAGMPPYNPYPPPPPHMGGQFVPVMAGHPAHQFQPVQMVPPNYPPPQYPGQNPHPLASSQDQVKPTDPPVYSYLVRRGYTPMDANNRGGNSPAGSVNSGQRAPAVAAAPPRKEEPDMPLQSGVEYMRR